MPPLDRETELILLNTPEARWLEYYNRLVVYAEWRCMRWRWRTGNYQNLPRGHSPESIAQEAVARLYDGSRRWNHRQYPGEDPVPFLKSVIDSLVYDLGHSADHEHTPDSFDDPEYPFERHPTRPDQLEAVTFERVHNCIRSKISDRADLVRVYYLLCDGLKPREVAAELGRAAHEIYPLIRAFHRRIKECLALLEPSGARA